ncbi:Asp23/Gls24 family envelope stress response protein [Desmospora activa]|uniref:Putative alkaline shock family protein YloU n=1 Tax=Desmospora activa DSM 45169 TaxID=1121389 RepID=A0A2T4Z9I2_9BACL|nr:Asp23/Gls24 family envelope stress response protein [Desmospora activa]PTM58527.1 putative alkaline shock family protein YloU [Desmospora activa DSM 45169]
MAEEANETLQTDMGTVEIAPEVIQIIGGLAAVQVDGVAGTSGGVVDDINQILRRKNPKHGIKVELGEELEIAVSIAVHFGYHLPDVAVEVQRQVKEAIESMTGLVVGKVLVRVVEVKIAGEMEGSPKTDHHQRVK